MRERAAGVWVAGPGSGCVLSQQCLGALGSLLVTVEPLLKDTPENEDTCIKDTLLCPKYAFLI